MKNNNPPRLVSVKDRHGDALLDAARPAPRLKETLGIDGRARGARPIMAEPVPGILPSTPFIPPRGVSPAIILLALVLAFLGGLVVGSMFHV